ncbi:hypothetical protein AA103196_0933 [Ameyamaea chiangmaiensis NBRC 103196]|uniref:Uncharacterized protein n=1 Tax=Ameyamaea chiangmaiensis TaxID=442969 RepID=A0A850PF17_9PROT|nr:hypothetical protein [Ameyamaea chiangmaiensis]MBS4076234.1 hypothetical protein [Ameyamaea chiangmaiensis]NVN39691.1 hypothetical protein [Ameyamaea chiangmaiensis]GBQ64658.1 hypothetical protein AA103196_0933 [Ameyamaea chiangmaiensis NBRC 103196]
MALRPLAALNTTALTAALTVAAGLSLGAPYASAAPDGSSADDRAISQSTQGQTTPNRGEHLTVHGRRSIPPGYSDAPSNEINHGPDPDHLANVHRDAVTGSNLTNFGSAYQENGPFGSGQLGDATGNGWVTPRSSGP